MLPPSQYYLVLIRLQRQISFTIFNLVIINGLGADLVESLDAHEKELSDLTINVEHILNQAKSGLTNLDKVSLMTSMNL